MIRLLTFVLGLTSFSLLAQSNIDIGATWTYTRLDFGIYQPTTITVSSDTIINGKEWFGLSGVGGCAGNFRNTLIRESDSKVFMYDTEASQEYLLYDYDKGVGETWDVQIIGSNTYYQVHVDSIGTIELDGQNHRIQYIDNADFGAFTIEGVGSNKYLFPQGNICDPQYFDIRCFSNNSMELDFDSIHDCDESFVVVGLADIDVRLDVDVSPNPTNGIVNITSNSNDEIKRVKVLSTTGALMEPQKNKIHHDRIEINMSQFTPGIYLLLFESNNNFGVKKIILE